MTGPDHTLELKGVTVSFADGEDILAVLDGANLSVGAGEIVTVSGRSGSGKSTLIALAGLLRSPDSGTVGIAGVDTANLSDRQRTELRRDEIGIIYQAAELFPALTAVQQLELVAHVRHELDDSSRARARTLLDEMGLGDRMDHLPGKLSGGERQRVGIARALMAEPSVLLADEPTASLDRERGDNVMALLVSEARSRDLATVIVSHDPAHRELSDRTFILEAGQLNPLTDD